MKVKSIFVFVLLISMLISIAPTIAAPTRTKSGGHNYFSPDFLFSPKWIN